MKYTVISPVYNASNLLALFVKKVLLNIEKISKNFEIILIDDCSSDNSWQKLKLLQSKFKKIKLKKNKKNIGQHQTIIKALKLAKGELIFILDCDLQDDPSYFKKFLKFKNCSSSAIFGIIKKGSCKKGYLSKLYWFFFKIFSGIDNLSSITSFALIERKHAKKIINMNSQGFLYAEVKRKKIPIKYFHYIRRSRVKGKSSYTYLKLLKLGYDWIRVYNNLK